MEPWTTIPCPFCGGSRLRCIEVPNGYDLAAPPIGNAMKCQDCGAHGPIVRAGAVIAWEQRAHTAFEQKLIADYAD